MRVPSGPVFAIPARMKIRKILVAVDFSPESRGALADALSLASSFSPPANVDLVHVWDSSEALLPDLDLRTDKKGTATRLLEESAAHGLTLESAASFMKEIESRGIEVRAFMRSGAVAQTISSFARDHGYDLVVMGTHGRTGMRRAVIGSVAEEVVRTSVVPVLTTRNWDVDALEASVR